MSRSRGNGRGFDGATRRGRGAEGRSRAVGEEKESVASTRPSSQRRKDHGCYPPHQQTENREILRNFTSWAGRTLGCVCQCNAGVHSKALYWEDKYGACTKAEGKACSIRVGGKTLQGELSGGCSSCAWAERGAWDCQAKPRVPGGGTHVPPGPAQKTR
jgi:hypothetical protein